MRAALIALLLLAACPAWAGTVDLLPEDGFMDGWVRDGDPQFFHGAELYGHINGGSEIFLEHGFDHLLIQHFSDDRDRVVTAELYVMDDPLAALGIYLLRINGKEQPNPGIEQRHSTNPRQVLLVTGNLFAVITNPAGTSDIRPIATELARQIGKRAPGGRTSDPFSVLPTEDRVPLSERVVAGPFTLQALVTLGAGDILCLVDGATAVAADYSVDAQDPTTLIVVRHASRRAAKAALVHLVANLDSYIEPLESTDARLLFKDYMGRFGEVRVVGSKVEIRVNLGERP